MDPLTKVYPFYTPYSFAGNSPIMNLDIDGEEEENYLLHLLRVYLGLGPHPKSAEEAYFQSRERQATQNVLNDVQKLGDAYNKVYETIIPGYSALYETVQGNYGKASVNLGIDLFGVSYLDQ